MEENNINENKYYCYMTDTMDLDTPFKSEDYKLCFDEKVCDSGATVRGLCYRNPDTCSDVLYKDLNDAWGSKFKTHIWRKYKLLSDDEKVSYSSDYIGPSMNWAREENIPEEFIGEAILKCRTIGGHILWPSHRLTTINTSRGGKQGFYDCFDLTLYEIKRYYDTNTKPAFIGKNRVWNVISAESDYFSLFKDFKDFIKFWHLEEKKEVIL